MKNKTNKIVRFSFLLAIAILLHYVEGMIPIPFMFPGVRLGLANSVALVVLAFWGAKDYFYFGMLRVLMVGLLRTGLFGTAFLLSFSGVLLSSIFTIIVYKLTKCSVLGLSVVSSIFHGVGQIAMVCIIYSNVYMISYLPVLMIANLITGCLLSFLIVSILTRMPESIYPTSTEEKIVSEKCNTI